MRGRDRLRRDGPSSRMDGKRRVNFVSIFRDSFLSLNIFEIIREKADERTKSLPLLSFSFGLLSLSLSGVDGVPKTTKKDAKDV